MKTWYAVQFGDNFDWDFGSYDYDEAEEMANKLAEDERHDGEEIRIAVIDEDESICDDEIIIREGTR